MQVNFDATGHQPQSFDPLPSGWYNVRMVEGLETPVNGKPQNSYFKSVWEVIDGEYKGRKLFHNFNFKNDNEVAVKIAYDQLATIMHGVGLLKIQTMEQLFNKPLQAKVKLKPPVMEADGVTEKYEAGNEIKGFRPLEGAAGSASAATGTGGLPEGFDDDQVAAAASELAVAAETPKAAAIPSTAAAIPSTAAIPAVAAKVKKLVMTDKLPGVTAAQFRETDPAWTDEKLVAEGYAKWVEVDAEVPKAETAVASIPAASTATAALPEASAADADDDTPPWLAEGQA